MNWKPIWWLRAIGRNFQSLIVCLGFLKLKRFFFSTNYNQSTHPVFPPKSLSNEAIKTKFSSEECHPKSSSTLHCESSILSMRFSPHDNSIPVDFHPLIIVPSPMHICPMRVPPYRYWMPGSLEWIGFCVKVTGQSFKMKSTCNPHNRCQDFRWPPDTITLESTRNLGHVARQQNMECAEPVWPFCCGIQQPGSRNLGKSPHSLIMAKWNFLLCSPLKESSHSLTLLALNPTGNPALVCNICPCGRCGTASIPSESAFGHRWFSLRKRLDGINPLICIWEVKRLSCYQ